MVDALRRACGFLTPSGCVVDVHPTAALARLEVGELIIGPIDVGDAPLRHEAATTAVSASVAEGFVWVEQMTEFDFYTYGDSAEELAGYIEENWREARIDKAAVRRAREAMRTAPAAKPRVLERVRINVLRSARL
jgi:hypothetical protein